MAYNSEKGNKSIREAVLTQTWQYIYENFHKFTEANKIKVALAITTKSMPTTIEGDIVGTRVIIVRSNADSNNAAEKRTDVISERLEGSAQALAG